MSKWFAVLLTMLMVVAMALPAGAAGERVDVVVVVVNDGSPAEVGRAHGMQVDKTYRHAPERLLRIDSARPPERFDP